MRMTKALIPTLKENPAEAALTIKRTLLESVDKIDALKGKTVSDGRLNLLKAAEAIRSY